VRVLVRQIRIVGNTVFPMEKLLEVTQRYVNRELATEDLEALRIELTRLYIDAGYINSGAIIPDQKLSEGVITLQIIEGELSTIEISGTTWFRDSYIRNRITLGAGPPLNIVALQERLQFLQQDERIARLAAELRPGVQRGESVVCRHRVHGRLDYARRYGIHADPEGSIIQGHGFCQRIDSALRGRIGRMIFLADLPNEAAGIQDTSFGPF